MNVDQWIKLLAMLTLIEMMFTIGLGVKIVELLTVVKDWPLILRASIANYILVPAAAIGLLLLLRPNPMVAAGFVIAAVCPGAPYGPPFTSLAKGNVITAVGLMVVLAGSSAIIAPILLRMLLPIVTGTQTLQINAMKMVSTLALTQFLPLCVGLFLAHKNGALAAKILRPAGRVCTILNLLLLTVILSVQFRMLADIRFVGYLGMLALVFAAVFAGFILASGGISNRKTLALTTGVRNVGVALVIASSSFAGTAAVTATTAFGLFQTLVIALIALTLGRLAAAKSPDHKLVTA